jgi:hypothetical protein
MSKRTTEHQTASEPPRRDSVGLRLVAGALLVTVVTTTSACAAGRIAKKTLQKVVTA